MRCELVSWEQFRALAKQLALRVQSSGFKPDMIVAIGRGGYMPARLLSDFLDIYNLIGLQKSKRKPVSVTRFQPR